MARRFAANAAAVLTTAAVALGAAAIEPPPPSDPMTFFQKLVPVFQHPRCLNCHGAINLATGLGHGGGAIRPAGGQPQGVMLERLVDCDDCHTESPPQPHDWKLAPPIFAFVGLDARGLCRLQADFVMSQGVGGYIHHLETDPLIDLAFQGTGAGPIDPAVRPRMTKEEFMDAAAEWLNAGNGACVEEGTIRETRQMTSSEAWNMGPTIAVTLLQSGRREVTIREQDGQFMAHTVVLGESVLRQVVTAPGCTATNLQNTSYSGTHDGPATVRSTVAANGTYTIVVTGPEETYRELVTGSSTGGCGLPPGADDPQENEIVWPAWTITIKGRLANPRDRRRLAGVSTRTIVNQDDVQGVIAGDTEGREYLTSFMSHSTQDGKSSPIEVTTDWNLLYGR